MHIKLDTREHNTELIDAFEMMSIEKGFAFEKTCLEVGDVVSGNIVIERKEAGDFVSSIMDGRLTEQAPKMASSYSHCYLIIEGNPYQTASELNKHAIIGKMTSLLIKYNIRLLFVETPEQFVYACFSIINKHELNNTFNPAEYRPTVYKATDEDIVTNMLVQIPRLGIDKAKVISGLYGHSIKRLTTEVKQEDLEKLDGIGSVMSERIVKLLTT